MLLPDRRPVQELGDALPPLAPGSLKPRPKARLQPDQSARKYGVVMEPCQAGSRDCKIPYTSAAAAAETFSDPTRPRCGSAISASQAAATRGRSPRPSDPRTSTTLPE